MLGVKMDKTKVACVVNSTGLAVLTVVVLGAIEMPLMVHCFGWWVAPQWLIWLAGLAIVVLVPVAFYHFYRLYFEQCERSRAQVRAARE